MIDEGTLIDAARGGDHDAFNQVVMQYQASVYSKAYWILRDRQWAEDLVQEAWIKAYQNLSQYRGGSFGAWLSKIVTNACLDELRRHQRRSTISLNAEGVYSDDREAQERLADRGPSVEEVVERTELAAEVQRHLGALRVENRVVLMLVDILDYDYVAAARALKIPVGTLKSRLARARSHLRSQILMAGLQA